MAGLAFPTPQWMLEMRQILSSSAIIRTWMFIGHGAWDFFCLAITFQMKGKVGSESCLFISTVADSSREL